MTTIAYKDGILASDSLASSESHVVGYCDNKVTIVGNKAIAFTGDLDDKDVFIKWVINKKGKKPQFENGFGVFVIDIDTKELTEYKDGERVDYKSDFYTMGSGSLVAIGAMAHGATAKEAVEIACKYNLHTGGEVHVYDFNKKLIDNANT